MKTVPVDLGPRSYEITVGAGALAHLATVLTPYRQVAVVSQDGIARAWWPRVRDACGLDDGALVIMGDGEHAKSLATIDELCRRFAAAGLLRGDALVALGGGVVGDAAGFAAAVYYRGIAVVQAPTTLLAQVDAAIGGKTAVNLPEGKNLVGAFHQPVAVIADVDTLATLPEREYRAGLGEVAKYALMGDAAVYAALLAGAADGRIQRRDPDLLTDVVHACATLKATVVAGDEHERTGVRATLNYGHTLAHALETAGGHELLHGEAVAIGLVFAVELAAILGRVGAGAVEEHRRLIEALHLPVSAPAHVSADSLVKLMRRDKKAQGGLTFVLPGLSGLEVVHDPDPGAVAKALWAVGVER